MKTCFKCGTAKPRSEFYRHRMMADGLLGKCKECTKADVIANRAANIDRYREFDRGRADLPHRIEARKATAEARRSDPKKREIDLRGRERWLDRNFVKRRAYIVTRNAIRSGRLKRPETCSRCLAECAPNAHHEDYYRALEVTWLCDACHGLRHREINEEIRSGADLRCRGFDLPSEIEEAA